jgi:hypothetical protein
MCSYARQLDWWAGKRHIVSVTRLQTLGEGKAMSIATGKRVSAKEAAYACA